MRKERNAYFRRNNDERCGAPHSVSFGIARSTSPLLTEFCLENSTKFLIDLWAVCRIRLRRTTIDMTSFILIENKQRDEWKGKRVEWFVSCLLHILFLHIKHLYNNLHRLLSNHRHNHIYCNAANQEHSKNTKTMEKFPWKEPLVGM